MAIPPGSRGCRHERGYNGQDYLFVNLMSQAAEFWFKSVAQISLSRMDIKIGKKAS